MPCHRCTAVGRCHQKAIHQIPWALSNVKNLLQYDVNTRLYKTITVRLMIPRLMENWTDQWEGCCRKSRVVQLRGCRVSMPPKYIWEQARLYTVSYKSISKAIPLCASCHEEVDLSLWIVSSSGYCSIYIHEHIYRLPVRRKHQGAVNCWPGILVCGL